MIKKIDHLKLINLSEMTFLNVNNYFEGSTISNSKHSIVGLHKSSVVGRDQKVRIKNIV